MGEFVKDAGVWKEVKPNVKHGGVWKEVVEGFVKEGGVWRQFFQSVVAVDSIVVSKHPDNTGNFYPHSHYKLVVTITYADSTQSTDCTLLAWSILAQTEAGQAIISVQADYVTVDTGTLGQELIFHAEAPEGIFGELSVSIVCLACDSQVMLVDGSSVRMDSLSVGDAVMGVDPITYEIKPKEIALIFEKQKFSIFHRLCLENGKVLETTPEHLCYVIEGGRSRWIEAKDIIPRLHAFKDTGLVPVSIQENNRTEYAELKEAFNIELADGYIPVVEGVISHQRNYMGS